MRVVRRRRVWHVVVAAVIVFSLPAAVLAQSWTWRDAGQYGYWTWGTTDRFRYDYSATQWEDWTTFSGWQKLGAVGASPVTREQGLDFEHFIGNGTWRDLLAGWQYLFDTSYNGCSLWRDNTDPFRFSYCYTTGQWNDFSWYSSGYWTGLGIQGLSQVSIGDGGWYNLGNGWEYEYVTSPTMGCSLWRDNTGPLRFSYCYNTGQWNDFSFYTPGYWSGIGLASMSSAFIGDTNWHDLGNGWAYAYTAVSNMGVSLWRDNTAPMRFSYCYNTGQWNDFSFHTPGYWTGLGPGHMSSAFIGDNNWHDLGTGWSYRYDSSGGYAVWKDGDGYQFSYGYVHGMWNDYYAGTNTWYGLESGGLSADFIGDGNPHNLGNGWWYAFTSPSASWYTGDPSADGVMRFAYDYSVGQWRHYGYGGTGYDLGVAGLSNCFVGDGQWHDVGTIGGADWRYEYTSGVGGWQEEIDATWTERFQYNYADGQWYHRGTTTAWAALGATEYSAEFLGDGEWHQLDAMWSYSYVSASDDGYFRFRDSERFSYDYGPGQWYHKGNTTAWAALTAANYSAAFIGDGAVHDLGSGVGYYYTTSGDNGWFKVGDSERFWYNYSPSQWYHKGYTTAWGALSAAGVSALFVGDGEWHDLGNGFSYQFVKADAGGYFKIGDSERFWYQYSPSQWYHKGATTDWAALTAANYSAAFIGDGKAHYLGNGVSYYYTASGDNGWFKIGGYERFWYAYTPSQWHHHRAGAGSWADLSAAGVSALFVGDGEWHDLGTGWSYQYSKSKDYGYFKVGTAERFYYRYGVGQWYHKGDMNTAWAALTAADYSLAFIGDGGWHDLGDGFTYQYVKADEEGYFKVGTAQRFYYHYGPSQWFHKGNTTAWAELSDAGVSAAFVGDGGWYDLGNGFFYQYVTADQEGYFKVGSAQRLSYSYGPSQWFHKGDTTAWAELGAEGVSALFIGDGANHDLGAGFLYQYVTADEVGCFNVGGSVRFSYEYGSGQWFHEGDYSGSAALTSGNYSAQFIGDGGWHDLGNGFTYSYSSTSDYGYFKVGAAEAFYFGYSSAQWFHKGDSTAWPGSVPPACQPSSWETAGGTTSAMGSPINM